MYVQFLNEVIVSCITQGCLKKKREILVFRLVIGPAMLQLYGIFSESSAYGICAKHNVPVHILPLK